MMKRVFLCIFLVFWLPSLVFGLEVRFRQSAVARSPMLTLEDVAEIRPSSGARELGGTALFPAPEPGERTCYKSATLKAYVRRAVEDGRDIKWSGADNVCVRHSGSMVSPEKIRAVVNSRLRDALAHLSAQKVAFSFRNRPEPVSVPPGRVSFDVLFSDPDVLKSRQASVIIKVDSRVEKNLSVPGEVRAFLPVIAAAKKMNRGHVITRADVVTRLRNIAELRRPCLDQDEAAGLRLKRSVSGGQVLSKRDLERPVLVERRQLVTMVLKKGALRILARGMATADGREGEIILVQNMRSQREVPCKVIGNGLVKVDF